MFKYLLRKTIYFICALFCVATLTFFLMKMIPGDPFSEEQGQRSDMLEQLHRYYRWDEPWYHQYSEYLIQLSRGQLGQSIKYQHCTVQHIIIECFPVSATLGMQALLLAIVGGILLGTVAASKKGQWQDRTTLLITMMSISVPSFIFATLLQYVIAIKLNLLPIARWGTFSQTILPSIALAVFPMAFIARLVRTNLIDVIQSDYFKIAKAKGLPPMRLYLRHALPNAICPVLSYLGPLIANILIGSFVIEKIFSIPGLGQWLVNSVSNRDYPVIMGLTLFYSTLLMGTILLVDIAYGYLDPRIRIIHREEQ